MGMLEMVMTMSYEQLLMDQEFVRMIRRVLQGIAVNRDTIALDVIEAVGPAGNYLMQKHTLKYMRSDLSTTKLINRRMRDHWESRGAKDMAAAAREEAIKLLETHKPIPLPDDVKARIHDIVAEGEAEPRIWRLSGRETHSIQPYCIGRPRKERDRPVFFIFAPYNYCKPC